MIARRLYALGQYYCIITGGRVMNAYRESSAASGKQGGHADNACTNNKQVTPPLRRCCRHAIHEPNKPRHAASRAAARRPSATTACFVHLHRNIRNFPSLWHDAKGSHNVKMKNQENTAKVRFYYATFRVMSVYYLQRKFIILLLASFLLTVITTTSYYMYPM